MLIEKKQRNTFKSNTYMHLSGYLNYSFSTIQSLQFQILSEASTLRINLSFKMTKTKTKETWKTKCRMIMFT